ncbi:protein ROOT PRIMORDIUM DEFECTIVE 1 [Panicum miliaceum]|uniref:Protein ROOT PRIMORDIUM DEFECTIVE 1 n=1 Tax=Panicum miliaceum TaxID=4540 RepID=A0A3L6TLA4_PANMI|nr:protein ROOT PRIMORDIUM DEFECTIVE 1 [Panicum miliaceum]
MSYVDVKMRWKKDASFDAVHVLSHARDLRPLVSLARLLSPSPTPVSAVSKRGRSLEVPDRRVTSFLRRFPPPSSSPRGRSTTSPGSDSPMPPPGSCRRSGTSSPPAARMSLAACAASS